MIRFMSEDVWAIGDAYEFYMGRWSRRVAVEFVSWLGVAPGSDWLDVGCGTGALTAVILDRADPAETVGIDTSERFVQRARDLLSDPRASLGVGDATALAFPDDRFDAAVSGLMLNFVPEAATAAAELVRVTRPSGTTAAFVWDYADGMTMLRHLWDAATELDPAASSMDEGVRFPMCQPDALQRLWDNAGLVDVAVDEITVVTRFDDFDDYWTPFLGGQGPAPGYVMSRSEHQRTALRDLLHRQLPVESDGSITLTARAWAVKGSPRDDRTADRGPRLSPR